MSGYPPYQSNAYPPPAPPYSQTSSSPYPPPPAQTPGAQQQAYPPYPPPPSPYSDNRPPYPAAPPANPFPPQNTPYPSAPNPSDNNSYGYGSGQDTCLASSSYAAQGDGRDNSNGLSNRGGPGGGRGRDRERSPRGRRPPRAGADRERGNNSVASRIARERRCRTLFVRNVNYEADNIRLRTSFESYGDVKDIYDMINTRGMMFVTYFDLRVADRAREGMHNTLINGRPIDVHYSLPKDSDTSGRCDREKNQGSVLAIGRGMRFLDERQVGDEAARHGAVKIVKYQREASEKLIEFYDSRDAVRFVDNLDGRPFAGGTLQLQLVWDDLSAEDSEPPLAGSGITNGSMPPPANGDPRGPPPANAGSYGERRSYEPMNRDGRNDTGPADYGRGRGGSRDGDFDRDRREPPPTFSRNDQNRYGDRPAAPPPPPGSGYGDNRYPDRPPPPPGYAAGPQPQQGQPDDRLEQARKVQQLLANLGSASAGSALGPPQHSGPPPPPPGPPSGLGHAQGYGYDRNNSERSRDNSGFSQQYKSPPPGGYRPSPSAAAPAYPTPPPSGGNSYAPPPRPSYDSGAPRPSQGPQPYQNRPSSEYPSYPPPQQSNNMAPPPIQDPRLAPYPPHDSRLPARPPAPMPPPPPRAPPHGANNGPFGQAGPLGPMMGAQGTYGRPPPPPPPASHGYGAGQGYQPSQPSGGGDLGSILANLQPGR